MVLAWDYLMYLSYFLLGHFAGNYTMSSVPEKKWSTHDFYYILSCLGFLMFPLFGLIADVWIGRYKAIMIGTGLCFLSWIIGAIGIIINTYIQQHFMNFFWIIFAIGYIFQYIGYTSFRANIIQYNIDQLVGASAIKLTTVIYWHATSIQVGAVLFYPLQCSFDDNAYFNTTILIASGASVSLVLVTHSFFKHKLENVSLINNPIKLIVRVLCYARNHKYPENRSALTYWEEEAPSRLELGKEKYGGPFTEEEVEDVKTIFRLLPLFIAVFGFALGDDFNWYISNSKKTFVSCVLPTDLAFNVCSFILLLVYLYLIRVCFFKYIPSMLARMSAGLVFTLANAASKIIIFHSTFDKDNSMILIVPQGLYSIAFILLYPVSLEFIVAQSPVHMKGVLVGMWYAFFGGFGYLVNISLQFPFKCEDDYICTDIYYHLTKSVLILLVLIGFVLLAKRYKYRVRENEVNIVRIVDEHYQRYMEQEEEFFYKNQIFLVS